jgi:hypothetical protein
VSNVLIVSLISLFIITITTYSKLFYSLLKIKKQTAKLLVTNIMLEEYIKAFEENKIKSDDSVHKENFIKFLSESRDWAYSYIEEVQSGIGSFIGAIDSDIEHFDEYGDVISVNRPDYDAMKRISIAYKELKKLLPEEEKI